MSQDDLLKEMQEECLKDPGGYLTLLQQTVPQISSNRKEAFATMIKTLQAINTNVEPVALKFLGEFVSQFEATLTKVDQLLSGLGTVDAGDLTILEFFVNDCMQSLESYFQELRNGAADSPELSKGKNGSLAILGSWQPESMPQAAPATSQTIAPVQPVAAAPVAAATSAATQAAIEVPLTEEATQKPGVHQFLMCRSGGRSFAIPVKQVLEVVETQALSSLPYQRNGLAGILNFRGDPLPILICEDSEFMAQTQPAKMQTEGTQERKKREKKYIIIASVNGKVFGFEMGQVSNVQILNPRDFQRPEMLSHQSTTWVTHFTKETDEIVLIMDLTKALAA